MQYFHENYFVAFQIENWFCRDQPAIANNDQAGLKLQ